MNAEYQTKTMTTEKQTHSEEQAHAQLSSIKEMISGLSRLTAAAEYARDLSREKCVAVLTDLCGIECRDEESIEDLREAVSVNVADSTCEPPDFEFDEEAARDRIQEDPLEISVRTDWHPIGADDSKPTHYRILLCTGGPAVCIEGELSGNQEPENARLLHQDWGTPWVELVGISSNDRAALLAYAQQFFYGE